MNIDPKYRTPEYTLAAECIVFTSRTCASEIWNADVIPVSVHHLVLYAKPDHWETPDTEKVEERFSTHNSQSFFDPVRALLSTRSSRAAIERNDLLFHVYGSSLQPHGGYAVDKTVILQNLDVEAKGFPLSWTLGTRLVDELRDEVSNISDCRFEIMGWDLNGNDLIGETGCPLGDIAVILTRLPLTGFEFTEF